MTGSLLCLLFAAVCALWYGGSLTHATIGLLRSSIKTLSTALLVVFASLSGASLWILVGLLCGAIGDWFLAQTREKGFLPGLAAFLLGHGAYLGFAVRVDSLHIWGPIQWVGAAFLVLASIWLFRRIWRALGRLRLPVAIYAGLSICLGFAGLSLLQAAPLFALGVLAFIASDMILALQLFTMEEGSARYRRASSALWALYWMGQCGILLGSLTIAG